VGSRRKGRIIEGIGLFIFVVRNQHSPAKRKYIYNIICLKHLKLLKQKDTGEASFNIEKIVGKLLRTENTRPFPLIQTPRKKAPKIKK
jgi:hypothetical protein